MTDNARDGKAGPALSVIMPNYNHARFIGEALEAILSQSRRPDELLVIDDASTDGSIEIIEGFSRRDPLVRLLRNERNIGFFRTVERGIENASGEYVFVPSADDKVLPGLFEKAMALFHRHPGAGVCYALTQMIDEHGNVTGVHETPLVCEEGCYISPESAALILRMYWSWHMSNPTIFKRSSLLEAGGFDPRLLNIYDGFAAQLVALKHGACFIPQPLGQWRKMEGGFASSHEAEHDQMIGVVRTAAGLMRTAHRDLFPQDYVDEWEKAGLVYHTYNKYALSVGRLVGNIREDLPPKTALQHAFPLMLDLVSRAARLSLATYIVLRFKLRLFPALGRKIRSRWSLRKLRRICIRRDS